ncbi:MAG: ATP-binding protein [Candidatus Brocadiales bacterium]|nr:ATP-binding protein [Candidatus Bathyanammoxibius amoris]
MPKNTPLLKPYIGTYVMDKSFFIVAVIITVAAFSYVLYRRRSLKSNILKTGKKLRHPPPSLDTLALGLAHEIRNPLSILSVNLQLLEEEVGDGTNNRGEVVKKKVQDLQREVQRLEEVVSDFLRFAHEERPRFAEHDVNKVVDEVVDFIAPEARRNNIVIDRCYETSIPPVKLDANLIKQALLNMMINAQQAMSGGGKLSIRTARKNDSLQIEVTDTGSGIRSTDFGKIFEVYYSTKNNGTGLGLPTVERIVEEHGGTVSVNSEEGKGSSFIVQLPLRRSC